LEAIYPLVFFDALRVKIRDEGLVRNNADFLYRVPEPAFRPIRSFLPNLGGIDISPVILFLILMFLRRQIINDLAPSLLY
jgi:YggT family protein